MARYQRTGMLPMAKQTPFWADVSMAPTDLIEAQQALKDSEKAFFALPSQLRAMFENSPVALLQWLDDPANKAEAVKWGLLPAPEEAPKAPSGGEETHQSAQ
ncbi:MAG: internal scaffolding protein [Microviridae sp.]|nr:MAG: internal scaffolding protein [Microviridae sp.]